MSVRKKRGARCRAFFRLLCEKKLDEPSAFAEPNGGDEARGIELYDEARKATSAVQKQVSDTSPGKLLIAVQTMVKNYYGRHEDRVVISFQEGLYEPHFSIRDGESGTGTAMQREKEPEFQVFDYFTLYEIESAIPRCRRFRISMPWFPQLMQLLPSFQTALRAGAEVTFLLSHPDSSFAKLRSTDVTGDAEQGRLGVISNRAQIRDYLKNRGGALSLKLTHKGLAMSYVEIDDRIYVGGLWFNRPSSDGKWISALRTSQLGLYFANQFQALLDTAEVDDLKGDPFVLVPNDGPLLRHLTRSPWAGEMHDVYRDDLTTLHSPEKASFSARKSPDGEVIGTLEIVREDGPTVTLSLRDGRVNYRHIAFTCEDQTPAVSRAGVLLLTVDEDATIITGFYTGWSPTKRTHYTCRLTLSQAPE